MEKLVFLFVVSIYVSMFMMRMIVMSAAPSMFVFFCMTMIVMIMCAMTMRASTSTTMSSMGLENTFDIVEDSVIVLSRTTTVTNYNQVNDIADKTDNRSNKHNFRIELDRLVVQALMYSANSFND